MYIKPIRNDSDLQEAFKRLEIIFQSEEGTPEFDEMEVLTTLIEVYENKYYPISAANPIDAIKFRMEQQSLTPKNLNYIETLDKRLAAIPEVEVAVGK